jgi:hypothetical protein
MACPRGLIVRGCRRGLKFARRTPILAGMSISRLPRLLLTAATALALVLVLVQSAFADPRDFELNNNSSVDIAYVYVSPSAADDWGDDIMGTDVLPAGQSVNVTFRKFDGETCNYDVKVVGVGGEEGYLYKVDLCSVSHVTFS